MFQEMSSSDNDEPNDSKPPSPVEAVGNAEKSTRYQCPDDFVTFCHKPCSGTLVNRLKKDKRELWLIKAPASFNPECFSGVKVPLSGLQTMQVPAAASGDENGSSGQIYSTFASSHGTSELHLLTSSSQLSSEAVFGPVFSGFLKVCESYTESYTERVPKAIPTPPAPSIPPGLKQRFQPFGSKIPIRSNVAKCEMDGPSSMTRTVKRIPEENEGGEKKKKKKKRKSVKVEPDDEGMVEAGKGWGEEVKVKEEPTGEFPIRQQPTTESPSQQGEQPEERTKKKKKKRDREREVEEDHVVKQEEVTVKLEPMATFYEDEGILEKKKKKKKNKAKD